MTPSSSASPRLHVSSSGAYPRVALRTEPSWPQEEGRLRGACCLRCRWPAYVVGPDGEGLMEAPVELKDGQPFLIAHQCRGATVRRPEREAT